MSCTGTCGGEEGYPLVLYTVDPSTSPGAFQRCWVGNSPCPSSWSSGGGAGVCTLGSCPAPCWVQGHGEPTSREARVPGGPSSGHRVAPGGTTTPAAARSPWPWRAPPAVTPAISQATGAWLLPGQEGPRCPGPSPPRPVPGGAQDPGCVPWGPVPALLESGSRSPSRPTGFSLGPAQRAPAL